MQKDCCACLEVSLASELASRCPSGLCSHLHRCKSGANLWMLQPCEQLRTCLDLLSGLFLHCKLGEQDKECVFPTPNTTLHLCCQHHPRCRWLGLLGQPTQLCGESPCPWHSRGGPQTPCSLDGAWPAVCWSQGSAAAPWTPSASCSS